MKHRSKPQVPTVHLIAEDKTGEFVFKEIIKKRQFVARVATYGMARGVSILASEIRGLIAFILPLMSDKDCIVVLHDTDLSVQKYRNHYQKIERICNSHAERVTRLEAVQEIEAWLLADDGICRWLDQKPRASDHVPQPSKRLESMINDKYGRGKWTNLNKEKILQQHMDVTGEKLSQSMKTAMDVLRKLPCVASNKP